MKEEIIYKIPEVRVCLKESNAPYEECCICTVDAATTFAKRLLNDLDREHLMLVTLDSKNKPINYHTVSIGGLNYAYADVKSVMKVALLSNAAGIMLFHNHPSGDPSPSQQDRDFTLKLDNACHLMDIRFLDHIIIGSEKNYSMNTEGLIKN